MSGHSHWSGIKRKKEIVDAKRGKLFSKCAKNITSAARVGGGNPDSNLDLTYAIQRAKDANMSKENIERAVKKGTGELPGVSLEWAIYEGYARGGAAVMVQVLTDNKTRTVAEIRHLFEKHGNSMGAPGCVSWMFELKGLITLDAESVDEEQVFLAALDAGAEDVLLSGDIYEIQTMPESMQKVRQALEKEGFNIQSGEISHVPKSSVKLEEDDARKTISFMNTMEDHEDVQNLFSNFEISEELMEQLADQ
jgi:YebC/PmpR family DNA-binding regulatory protein